MRLPCGHARPFGQVLAAEVIGRRTLMPHALETGHERVVRCRRKVPWTRPSMARGEAAGPRVSTVPVAPLAPHRLRQRTPFVSATIIALHAFALEATGAARGRPCSGQCPHHGHAVDGCRARTETRPWSRAGNSRSASGPISSGSGKGARKTGRKSTGASPRRSCAPTRRARSHTQSHRSLRISIARKQGSPRPRIPACPERPEHFTTRADPGYRRAWHVAP